MPNQSRRRPLLVKAATGACAQHCSRGTSAGSWSTGPLRAAVHSGGAVPCPHVARQSCHLAPADLLRAGGDPLLGTTAPDGVSRLRYGRLPRASPAAAARLRCSSASVRRRRSSPPPTGTRVVRVPALQLLAAAASEPWARGRCRCVAVAVYSRSRDGGRSGEAGQALPEGPPHSPPPTLSPGPPI